MKRTSQAGFLHQLPVRSAWSGEVVCDGAVHRLDQIMDRAARLSTLLSESGLQPGDRVGLWLPNGIDWLCAIFACSRLGLVVLAMNPRLGPGEAGQLIRLAGCRCIVLSAEHRGGECLDVLAAVTGADRVTLRTLVFAGSVGSVPKGIDAAASSIAAASGLPPFEGCTAQADAPFLMLATSGTTGLPKLVQHAQARICRHVLDAGRAFGFDGHSKVLLAIPMCGAYGFTIAMATLAAGVPLVVMECFEPSAAGDLIREHGITHMMGTDDMLDKMLATTDDSRPFPSLRMYGHANFTPGLRNFPQRAEARGVRLRGAYGLSEALASVAVQSLDSPLARRAEGGGHLVCPEAEFRIRDAGTGRLITDQTIGEIELRTPNVMLGYYNNPDATRKAFTDDGFLRTGDSGCHAEDGGLTYVSRINDVLRIGGYLVSPAEIEDCLRNDPAIGECQVVAVDLPEGSRPVAFVVLNPGCGLDEAGIIASCSATLARYKVPVRIFPVDRMPVTVGPNGTKIRKSELRDLATRLMEAG